MSTRGPAAAPAGRPLAFTAVVTVLCVHYASLAAVYLVDPGFAVRQFSDTNQRLGGVPFAPPDVAPWRYATVCAMATLTLMLALVLLDPARNRPLVVPVVFFKALNAVLWFWFVATNDGMPVFLLAGVVDAAVVALLLWVTRLPAPAGAAVGEAATVT